MSSTLEVFSFAAGSSVIWMIGKERLKKIHKSQIDSYNPNFGRFKQDQGNPTQSLIRPPARELAILNDVDIFKTNYFRDKHNELKINAKTRSPHVVLNPFKVKSEQQARPKQCERIGRESNMVNVKRWIH